MNEQSTAWRVTKRQEVMCHMAGERPLVRPEIPTQRYMLRAWTLKNRRQGCLVAASEKNATGGSPERESACNKKHGALKVLARHVEDTSKTAGMGVAITRAVPLQLGMHPGKVVECRDLAELRQGAAQVQHDDALVRRPR